MNRPRVLLFFFFSALCAAPAVAGPLAGDTTTYQTIWHGSTPYNSGTGLVGYIDWAVYAPNTVPAGFAGVGGYSVTPNEFLYAYQAYETGPALLSSISVVIDQNPADNIGDFTATGVTGDASFFAFLDPPTDPRDSANWVFDGVAQGGSTDGLAYFSPNTPQFTEATTIDGGGVALVLPVPSPSSGNIPEPSSLVLALCGLVGGFGCEMFRRRARKGSL